MVGFARGGVHSLLLGKKCMSSRPPRMQLLSDDEKFRCGPDPGEDLQAVFVAWGCFGPYAF